MVLLLHIAQAFVEEGPDLRWWSFGGIVMSLTIVHTVYDLVPGPASDMLLSASLKWLETRRRKYGIPGLPVSLLRGDDTGPIN